MDHLSHLLLNNNVNKKALESILIINYLAFELEKGATTEMTKSLRKIQKLSKDLEKLVEKK